MADKQKLQLHILQLFNAGKTHGLFSELPDTLPELSLEQTLRLADIVVSMYSVSQLAPFVGFSVEAQETEFGRAIKIKSEDHPENRKNDNAGQ